MPKEPEELECCDGLHQLLIYKDQWHCATHSLFEDLVQPLILTPSLRLLLAYVGRDVIWRRRNRHGLWIYTLCVPGAPDDEQEIWYPDMDRLLADVYGWLLRTGRLKKMTSAWRVYLADELERQISTCEVWETLKA